MRTIPITTTGKGQAAGPRTSAQGAVPGMVAAKCRTIKWLDGRSATFSALGGFSVTRRTVLALHAVIVLVMAAAVAAQDCPLVAVVAALLALIVTLKTAQKP